MGLWLLEYSLSPLCGVTEGVVIFEEHQFSSLGQEMAGRYAKLSPEKKEAIKRKEEERYWRNRESRAKRNYLRWLAQGSIKKPREETLKKHGITIPLESACECEV